VWTYPTSGPNCNGVWAPELHYLSGKWYIYYAATTCDNNNANHRMFVLEGNSQDPLGSYTDKGKIYDNHCYGILTNTSGNMLEPDAWVKKSTPVFPKRPRCLDRDMVPL
jgi:GH43 family beta-xylosidase